MNQSPSPISPFYAELNVYDLRAMVSVVRLLHKISELPAYQALLTNQLPASAKIKSRHYSVMMGYDFHLSESGPKLIEVNNNAGGLWYTHQCNHSTATHFDGHLAKKLLSSFLQEFALFTKIPNARPKLIAIVDEKPLDQHLYPEMQMFASLFKANGIDSIIVDPAAIIAKDGQLYIENKKIDILYNRHCDFYLETPAMALINTAWMNGLVCLSPNPRSYGLLADKRRLILWSQSEYMRKLGLNTRELGVLDRSIPITRSLESVNPDEVWRTHKQWVFKPKTEYASRGVYVGEKITKSKFLSLDPQNYLIQQHIPPSLTFGSENEAFKTDYRLFAYQNRIMAVSARIYHGQVTNLSTKNGGFAKVRIL